MKKLSDDKLISVYAFVPMAIGMPNHIHLIWSQDGMNGKETPKGSLLKYTDHIFLRNLKITGKSTIYEVNALNKSHEIWQRDSLGIEIYDKNIARQKLNYITLILSAANGNYQKMIWIIITHQPGFMKQE